MTFDTKNRLLRKGTFTQVFQKRTLDNSEAKNDKKSFRCPNPSSSTTSTTISLISFTQWQLRRKKDTITGSPPGMGKLEHPIASHSPGLTLNLKRAIP